mgnify:CR=1 FL=1
MTTMATTRPTITPALLHDVAHVLQRVVPRDDYERAVIERYMAAVVAGEERIEEIAARPGMGIDGVLDRHDFGEVALPHDGKARRLVLQDGAHGRALAASRSRVVRATLSRR